MWQGRFRSYPPPDCRSVIALLCVLRKIARLHIDASFPGKRESTIEMDPVFAGMTRQGRAFLRSAKLGRTCHGEGAERRIGFRNLVSCLALLLTTSSLARTPSPAPLRLKNTPATVHPLPQEGEGQGSRGVLSTIKWDRTLVPALLNPDS